MHRFCRLLFDTCRSTDDAVIPPPASGNANAASVAISGRRLRGPSVPRRNYAVAVDFAADDLSLARETPAYLWRKEHKWHVLSYDNATAAADAFPRSKIDARTSDDDDIFFSSKSKVCGGGWFSSEDEEEEEATLMASTSESKGLAFEAAGKAMRESMAVVKRSEDPRRDFRRSMVEMVVEKGMYDAEDLEEMLRCFLSLNSKHHHVAIVAAFADVWEALFSENSLSPLMGRPG